MKDASIRSAITLALFATIGISCASTQRATAVSTAGFDEVWKASIDALTDVRFSASSTDKASGLIIADQAVVSGGGTVSRLNITVSGSGTGTHVKVTFVPPPGTMGGGGTADAYVKALKRRLPDLQVSAAAK